MLSRPLPAGGWEVVQRYQLLPCVSLGAQRLYLSHHRPLRPSGISCLHICVLSIFPLVYLVLANMFVTVSALLPCWACPLVILTNAIYLAPICTRGRVLELTKITAALPNSHLNVYILI